MRGSVLAFRSQPQPRQGWSNQDLADLYRVKDILNQAGLSVLTDSGTTDEGDPWFIFVRSDTEDVVAHFARDGGQIVATGAVSGRLYRGRQLRDIINQLLADQPLLLPYNPQAAGNVRLHPLVVLSAFVAMAFVLHQKEAQAADSADGAGMGSGTGGDGTPTAAATTGRDGSGRTGSGGERDGGGDLSKILGPAETSSLSLSQSATLAAVISIAISMSAADVAADETTAPRMVGEAASGGVVLSGSGSGLSGFGGEAGVGQGDRARLSGTADEDDRDFSADINLGLWAPGPETPAPAALSVAASIMPGLTGRSGPAMPDDTAAHLAVWSRGAACVMPGDLFQDSSAPAPGIQGNAVLEDLAGTLYAPGDGTVSAIQGDAVLTAAATPATGVSATGAAPATASTTQTEATGAAENASGAATSSGAEDGQSADAANQTVTAVAVTGGDTVVFETGFLGGEEAFVPSDFVIDILASGEDEDGDAAPVVWTPTRPDTPSLNPNGGSADPTPAMVGHLVSQTGSAPLVLTLNPLVADVIVFEQGNVVVNNFDPTQDSFWIMGLPDEHSFTVAVEGADLVLVSQDGWRITFADLNEEITLTAEIDRTAGLPESASVGVTTADQGAAVPTVMATASVDAADIVVAGSLAGVLPEGCVPFSFIPL